MRGRSASPAASARAREARIRELQKQGFRGGRIAPHRAMIGLTPSWRLLFDLVALPGIQLLGFALFRHQITGAWTAFFKAIRAPLGIPGAVAQTKWELVTLDLYLPAFDAGCPVRLNEVACSGAAWPDTPALLVGWLVTLLLAVAGWLIRGAYTPFGYLLRAMAVIQLTAQLWFTFASPPFTYTLLGYQEAVFYLGTVVLFLAPIGTAFTFNIFDFRWWQKLALSGMMVAHLLVLLPLQVATHAYLIHRLTLLAMPMLYLLFGILLQVFVFISLYGWGMSWRSGGELDVGRRPPQKGAPTGGTPAPAPAGDPEMGRRAQAAREAAALAATIAGTAPPRPAAAAGSGGAPVSSFAPPSPAAPAPTPAPPPEPAPPPAPAPPLSPAPAPTSSPRVEPPRTSRAVPLVFGKPADAPPPTRKKTP